MSYTPPDLQANLDRLLARAGAYQPLHDQTMRASRLAAGLPLAHSVTTKNFATICCTRRLVSQKQLVKKGLRKERNNREVCLKTDDMVFFLSAHSAIPVLIVVFCSVPPWKLVKELKARLLHLIQADC